MTFKKHQVLCPYRLVIQSLRLIRDVFISDMNSQIMLIISLSVSIGIIYFALDVLKFPFVCYDTFSSILCLGGTRHSVGVLSALILIPICAAKKTFRIRIGCNNCRIYLHVMHCACRVHAVCTNNPF